jgi:hypothetical protein
MTIGSGRGTEAPVAGIEERVRGELSDLLDLIRRAGGGVVFEEFPEAFGDASRAEPMDDGGSAVGRPLIDEANRLAEALERIRLGEDGS